MAGVRRRRAAGVRTRAAAADRGVGAGVPLAQNGGMRLLVVPLLVAVVSLPVAARPHKRPHPRARPARVVQIVPNDRAAQEHARAEAELADLRAGRVGEDDQAAAAEPAKVWAIQENDAEVPANLRQKK